MDLIILQPMRERRSHQTMLRVQRLLRLLSRFIKNVWKENSRTMCSRWGYYQCLRRCTKQIFHDIFWTAWKRQLPDIFPVLSSWDPILYPKRQSLFFFHIKKGQLKRNEKFCKIQKKAYHYRISVCRYVHYVPCRRRAWWRRRTARKKAKEYQRWMNPFDISYHIW